MIPSATLSGTRPAFRLRSSILFLLIFRFGFLCPPLLGAEPFDRMTTAGATVLYAPAVHGAAEDVVRIYPRVRADLSHTLKRRVDFPVTVVLIPDNRDFRRMAGNPYFSAFAVGEKALMVIDLTKMDGDPGKLSATLKHELVHLVLHRYIGGDRLPRWLNEGVAQWVSDGYSELLIQKRWDVLRGAVLSGDPPDLDRLADRFPARRRPLLLAYEASKSAVEFMVREFGKEPVLNLLDRLSRGQDLEAAFHGALGVFPAEMERLWHRQLRRTSTWPVYLAVHLYEIIFIGAALATLFGFIRAVRKKRQYRDEEEYEESAIPPDEWKR
ncbi:MAG: peptidase MA family metallohydrolase [Thermodesulfobacteriota bacterium]